MGLEIIKAKQQIIERMTDLKLGQLEVNQIYKMDCMEGLQLIPDNSKR